MSVIPNSNQHVAQLIDANLDRAREGLRVIEDWIRYALKDKSLATTLKNWRHQLGQEHRDHYKNARLVSSDAGAGLSHPSQEERTKPEDIVTANFARVQEALRVLEEFSRQSHPKLSKISAQIRYDIYDLELNVSRRNNANIRLRKLKACKVYLITKPHKQISKVVLSAVQAGVTMVQFRCKEGFDSDNFKTAKKLASICKEHKSLFIINDRVDLAIASDADGVHLGQEDLDVKVVRELIGSEKLIGLSTHSQEQIKDASNQDCDYLGIGPIYKTSSKPNKKNLGIEFITKIATQRTIDIPWFAIGGINRMNVSDVNNAGARRIAVINAIMSTEDPYLASKELLETMK